VDGSQDIAGALIGPGTLARAAMLGRVPRDALANNDAHGFFNALGLSVVTGPTLTNVNDFRAVLVEGGSEALRPPAARRHQTRRGAPARSAKHLR
jgi:hydroxypyruvate reductase